MSLAWCPMLTARECSAGTPTCLLWFFACTHSVAVAMIAMERACAELTALVT